MKQSGPDIDAAIWTARLLVIFMCVALIAAALCQGCYGGYEQMPPNDVADQDALALQELEHWEEAFGPADDCWPDLAVLYWETVSEEALMRACGYEIWSGCMHYTMHNGRPTPTISIAADTPRTEEQLRKLRRHELHHWLEICSGLDPSGNPKHDDGTWKGLL